MKQTKLICVMVLITLLSIPAIAQRKQDNVKAVYLPEAGDFSFGISANPIINFVGNMFNNTASQSIGNVGGAVLSPPQSDISYYPTVSIMGKYMLQDNFGIRVNVGFIMNKDNQASYVMDDNAIALDPLSRTKVTDMIHESNNGGSISVGVEYRVGSGRIQGVFSGSLMYAYNTTSTALTYGNAITELNQTPTINNTWSNATNDYTSLGGFMPSARTLNISSSGYHSGGLVLGVGVEWFVAPKVSIGAEVNLAAIYTSKPKTYVEYEGYNVNSQRVENYTDLKAPRSSSFLFGTENIGGNLSVNFYF